MKKLPLTPPIKTCWFYEGRVCGECGSRLVTNGHAAWCGNDFFKPMPNGYTCERKNIALRMEEIS